MVYFLLFLETTSGLIFKNYLVLSMMRSRTSGFQFTSKSATVKDTIVGQVLVAASLVLEMFTPSLLARKRL